MVRHIYKRDSIGSADEYLTKEDSLIIKGVAAILLVAHHLLAFPDRIPSDVFSITKLFDVDSLAVIGDFGKIAVALFAFLGGYGKYIKYQSRKFNLFDDVFNLYRRYWRVFLVFIPIGFLFFREANVFLRKDAVIDVFSNFSFKELILNFLGLQFTYNREWWFLLTYVLCICMFPLFKTLVEKLSAFTNVLLLILFESFLIILIGVLYDLDPGPLRTWAINVLVTSEPYFQCFYLGIIVSRYGLFSRLSERFRKLRFSRLLSLLVLICLFVVREKVRIIELDCLYTAIFVFALKKLFSEKAVIKKSFVFLGRNSTNIWLVHSFFCYYFGMIARSVVHLHWVSLMLVALIAYSLIASVSLDFIWDSIRKMTIYVPNLISSKRKLHIDPQ